MATSTVEDYIKRLYLEQQHCGEDLVPLGRLATAMSVVPGTVTTMVKALAESGLVRYEPRQGVRLTAAGEKLALHVLRRHRLVELFLVKVLGFDWADVHDEAEELEHAISERLIEKIDEYLGRPDYDPHGDPIPTASGDMASRRECPLSDCRPAQRVRVVRISDQDPRFLRYAEERGLTLDALLTVVAFDDIGDAITVRTDNGPVTLGTAAAGKILVISAENDLPNPS